MELKDFIPEKPTFTLGSTGKTYELRIPNLEDKVELIRVCGGPDQVEQVFRERNWPILSKLIYRLMIDKSDFLARKEMVIDDDGVQKEVFLTGPVLLMRAIRTQQESIAVLTAFNSAGVASEPLMKDYVESEVKKNLSNGLIGENSAMSSQVNTATLQERSESLPLGS